jgi:hypothetical protein
MWRWVIAVLAVILMCSLSLSAQAGADDDDAQGVIQEAHEQPLQEVFQTELVYPQERGEVQFTFAPQFAEEQKRDLLRYSLGIEYGLTDAWQVVLECDSLVLSDAPGKKTSGIGDLELETQYSFMNIAGSDVHAALRFGIGFPTGSAKRGLSEGFIEYEPSVLLAKDFPRLLYFQLFTQIGVRFVDRVKGPAEDEEREPSVHEFFWSSGVFLLTAWGVLTSELTWATNKWNTKGEEEELFYSPGIVMPFAGGWEVGVGVPIGLTKQSDDLRMIGHVIYEF